jgi:hypothetical protein
MTIDIFSFSIRGGSEYRLGGFALLLLFAAIMFPAVLHAGPWTQDANHGQLITSLSWFQTSRTFDSSGSVERFGYGGRFRQWVLNPYMEYGLTSRYTLVLNAQVPFLNYVNTFNSKSSAGPGDIEIGARRRLNGPESRWILSSQLTAMFPAYSATRDPAPGNHEEDLETRFLIGRNATLLHRHLFWDAQLAYRARFGAPADQFRSDLTAGMDISKRLMAMGQFFNIWSMRNGQPSRKINNPNAQSDYDLQKYQLSILITAANKTRIQVGWNNTLAGRNTGRGQTAIIALWMSF